MINLHVATSRPVGERCRAWLADGNLPAGCLLTDAPDRADVFVSVMYDTLLDERYINGAGPNGPRRCYNFHPGLLPEYRGSGAFSWALINGERETGVTLHELDVGMDHGPILARWTFPIHPHDTAGSLFETAADLMFEQFKLFLPRLARGEVGGTPQDESKARLYYRRDLEAARDLTRFARAFAFEGKPAAFWTDRDGARHEVRW